MNRNPGQEGSTELDSRLVRKIRKRYQREKKKKKSLQHLEPKDWEESGKLMEKQRSCGFNLEGGEMANSRQDHFGGGGGCRKWPGQGMFSP